MLLLAYLSIFLARKQKCQRNALAWFFVHVCLFVLRLLCWVFWVCFLSLLLGIFCCCCWIFCSFYYFPFLFFPFHCSTFILGLKDIVEEECGYVMFTVLYDWEDRNCLYGWEDRNNPELCPWELINSLSRCRVCFLSR